MTAEIKILRVFEDAILPTRATEFSAGLDLYAYLNEESDNRISRIIPPGAVALVSTGIAIALPPGHEGQIRPRSGLAAKHGVTVLNSPGTIDEDYRGPVKVLLINHGRQSFTISHGDRIAQLVVCPVTYPTVIESNGLEWTARGSGGFGSTGT